jgi:hypothetical protein
VLRQEVVRPLSTRIDVLITIAGGEDHLRRLAIVLGIEYLAEDRRQTFSELATADPALCQGVVDRAVPAAELRLQGQLHRRSYRALRAQHRVRQLKQGITTAVKQACRPTRNRDNPHKASTRAGISCRLFITAFWCSWISWRELSVTRRPFARPANSRTQS